MKTTRLWIALAALVSTPAVANTASGNAMLDLVTCQGAVLLTQSMNGDEEATERVKAMESLFADLRNKEIFVPSGTASVYLTPAEPMTVADANLDSFGPAGFGIFKGPSVVLDGSFEEVKATLSAEHAVDYGNCKSNGQLKVCSRELAPGLSRLLMSHPGQPTRQAVLICVEGVER